jgi:hypothetical protein
MKWWLLLALGCGSSETFIQPEQYEESAGDQSTTSVEVYVDVNCGSDCVAGPDALPAVAPAALPIERVLRLAPPPELRAVFERSVQRYQQRLGLHVELVDDGIPVTLTDHLVWGGKAVDAVTRYERYCAFEACNSGHGVTIVVDRALLGDKAWALDNTIDHEIGHIVSGWGHEEGVPLHIAEPGHLMSLGCVNHVCAPWTSEDATMLCAGAPCMEIKL